MDIIKLKSGPAKTGPAGPAPTPVQWLTMQASLFAPYLLGVYSLEQSRGTRPRYRQGVTPGIPVCLGGYWLSLGSARLPGLMFTTPATRYSWCQRQLGSSNNFISF